VSVCVPVVAKDVFKTAVALAPAVAVPPAGTTAAVPIVVAPSLNVTFVVGPTVLLLAELIVTDSVTAWLTCTVLAPGERVVVVVAGDTITVSVTAVVTAL
jgi:hypothetical protein